MEEIPYILVVVEVRRNIQPLSNLKETRFRISNSVFAAVLAPWEYFIHCLKVLWPRNSPGWNQGEPRIEPSITRTGHTIAEYKKSGGYKACVWRSWDFIRNLNPSSSSTSVQFQSPRQKCSCHFSYSSLWSQRRLQQIMLSPLGMRYHRLLLLLFLPQAPVGSHNSLNAETQTL